MKETTVHPPPPTTKLSKRQSYVRHILHIASLMHVSFDELDKAYGFRVEEHCRILEVYRFFYSSATVGLGVGGSLS